MARSSHPSLPPTSEHSPQRLGPRGGGERPLRAQLVLAAMLLLILIAVPLYLLRRPSASRSAPEPDAGTFTFGGVVQKKVDAGTGDADVVLGPLLRVRCGASANQSRNEGNSCDPLPPLEVAFRRTLRENRDCAPQTGKEGSINYVLEVDFRAERLNIFPGQSGKWHGPQARKATACMLRHLPNTPWAELSHQHDYYALAILATYPAPDPGEELPSFD
jgi:hypothetical protein